MNKALLIVAGLVVFLIVGYFGIAILSRSARSSVAENRGVAFINKLYSGYTIAGQSCQGEDTDQDSYVSCDFRILSPANEERVVHLQCPVISKSILGGSCKEARAVVSQ